MLDMKKIKGDNSNVNSAVKYTETILAILNPVMTSTLLFNNSNSDELFVLDVDEKIVDEKYPRSPNNVQK